MASPTRALQEVKRPPNCPACGCDRAACLETHGGYLIWRCRECGLQFSDPMLGLTSNYAQAYDGNPAPPEVAGEGLPFLSWTEQASPGLVEFPSFLTSAQQLALKLARERFAAESHPTALEIGFGAGWFLGALRSVGFQAYGLEVADAPVDALQRKGFAACKASLSDFPADWPHPALITCFEVLEHLEDPAGFLGEVRRQFPAADLMLSVPDERRWFLLGGREAHDYAPNHLTRWSPQALSRVLHHAGFTEVTVFRVRPTAQELSMASLRRFLPFLSSRAATGGPPASTSLAQELRKRKIRRWLFSPLALALPVFGWTACSMLALATNRRTWCRKPGAESS